MVGIVLNVIATRMNDTSEKQSNLLYWILIIQDFLLACMAIGTMINVHRAKDNLLGFLAIVACTITYNVCVGISNYTFVVPPNFDGDFEATKLAASWIFMASSTFSMLILGVGMEDLLLI